MVKYNENQTHQKKNHNSQKKSKDQQDEDSEDELEMKRNPRNIDDPGNRLKLDQFHKQITKPGKQQGDKKRKHTDKKKIRDIERLLAKEGLPEAIKVKKTADLKLLKRDIKEKKDAIRYEDRYKKIKFIEKRKVIRQLQKIDKQIQSSEKQELNEHDLQMKKQEWKNKLAYIDNYPINWKYVSLFAQTGDAENDKATQELRQEKMDKILQTVDFKAKLREKEILEADKQVEQENTNLRSNQVHMPLNDQDEVSDDSVEENEEKSKEIKLAKKDKKKSKKDKKSRKESLNSMEEPIDEKIKKKQPEFIDPFFRIADDNEYVEKRVVDREGKIPKLQKNIDKAQREKEEAEERRAQKQMEREWGIKTSRPIKINANAYRADKTAGKIQSTQKPNHQML